MMKTTKILTAFTLPLMLAACSQDAELENVLTQGDYSNIPTVDVNFTVNTGAESRMASKFGWELDDKIGVAWLGDGATVNGSFSDGKAYQNNPFYCSDVTKASFESKTQLYVGKYFTYMPFNENVVNIGYIPFTVDGLTLSTDANDYAKHSIYITPQTIELEEVEEGKEATEGKYPAGLGHNIPLNMRMLSNAVTLNLTFENATNLSDLKVTGISIDIKRSDESHPLVKSFNYKGNQDKSADAKDWTEVTATDFYTNCVDGTPTSGVISLTNKEGLAVSNGKLKTYAVLLPVNQVIGGAATLTITVNTNYGDVAVTNGDAIKVAEGGKDVTNWYEAGIFTKFGQSGTITVNVDAKDITIANNTVATQADLTAALNAMAATGQETPVNFTLNPEKANEDNTFVLTDFTMPEGLKAPVTLTADGTNANTLVFAGNTVINKALTLGTLTSAEVTGNMTVKAVKNDQNAIQTTLTIGSGNTLTIDNDAVLNNEGQIDGTSATIVTTDADEDEGLAAGKYVSNGEEATISGSPTFTNSGEVQWIAGTLPRVSGTVYAEVDDFKDVNAANSAKVTTVRFMNETSFDNFGTDLEFANITAIEIYAPVTINLMVKALNSSATAITCAKLTGITIKEGASLKVTSDNKANTLSAKANAIISVEKNATLDMSQLTLTNFKTMTYAGAVTFTNVDYGTMTATKAADSEGSFSQSNN